MGLVIIKKPVEGAYNNGIVNGTFVSVLAPWKNRDIEDITWIYSGGSAYAAGISTPSTFTRKLEQFIPIVAGQSYDYTLTKEIASNSPTTKTKMVLKQIGGIGEQQVVNSTNNADGSFDLSGTFVASANYHRVYIEVSLESV
jgi:hypothetical protein